MTASVIEPAPSPLDALRDRAARAAGFYMHWNGKQWERVKVNDNSETKDQDGERANISLSDSPERWAGVRMLKAFKRQDYITGKHYALTLLDLAGDLRQALKLSDQERSLAEARARQAEIQVEIRDKELEQMRKVGTEQSQALLVLREEGKKLERRARSLKAMLKPKARGR